MSFQEFTTADLENEVWKTIPGFEGRYEVSNLGRVKSFVHRRSLTLRQAIACGYPYVRLYKKGVVKCFTLKVHRLVLLAFQGNSDKCVNHRNGVKTDNRLENLEYATYSENTIHAFKTGLTKAASGERHWHSKLSSSDVELIKEQIQKGSPLKKLAEMFNVSPQSISDIKRGRRRRDG